MMNLWSTIKQHQSGIFLNQQVYNSLLKIEVNGTKFIKNLPIIPKYQQSLSCQKTENQNTERLKIELFLIHFKETIQKSKVFLRSRSLNQSTLNSFIFLQNLFLPQGIYQQVLLLSANHSGTSGFQYWILTNKKLIKSQHRC